MDKQLIGYLILLAALNGSFGRAEIEEKLLNTQIKAIRQNMNTLKKLFYVNKNFFRRLSDAEFEDISECPEIFDEPEEIFKPTYSNLLSSCINVTKNGVRELYVPGSNLKPFYAYCTLDPRGNGSAWIIILKRQSGKYAFDRDFEDYQMGFGNVESEYWIGLNNLHALTYFQRHELWIHIKENSEQLHLRYKHFAIDDEESGYLLNVLGPQYSFKNNHDHFNDLVGNRFSSRTTDYSYAKCVNRLNTSWWMLEYSTDKNNDCSSCHFTGPHSRMLCKTFKPDTGAFRYVTMAIRPTNQ